MAEEKERANLHIHLSGSKYLVSNGMSYWIESQTPYTNKKGEPDTRSKRLSGYHNDLISLMDSYFSKQLKTAEIDGEISDFAKLIKKVRSEIRSWWKKTEEVMEE